MIFLGHSPETPLVALTTRSSFVVKMSEMNESKKWLISAAVTESATQESVPNCTECEKMKLMMQDYRQQLEEEKKAMDETISLVERLERDHKIQINEMRILLNFEKDKVIQLEKSLETERKARIEDIYKQDRERKDFNYISKDYEIVNNSNQEMITEFEIIKNQNTSLTTSLSSLQENKQSLLIELKKYEEQVTDLENHNQSLRKRLYEAETQRDKYQIQIVKLKEKVSALSLESMSRTLRPLGTTQTGQKKKFNQTGLLPMQSTQSTVHNCAPSPCLPPPRPSPTLFF
jgi:chromosome segregation ATPase